MDTDPRHTPNPERETELEGDSSDIVDGQIGAAHLVDPTDAEPLSADLEALPAFDGPESPDSRMPDEGDGPNR